MTESTQCEVQPLSYEQEVHALLCAAASNTEGFIQYLEAQSKNETGYARRLTLKCIDWKRDDLRRIRELIPQALQKRDASTFTLPDELMDGAVVVRLTSAMADLALKRTARDKADSDFALAIEEARAACRQVASEITALANGSETPAGS